MANVRRRVMFSSRKGARAAISRAHRSASADLDPSSSPTASSNRRRWRASSKVSNTSWSVMSSMPKVTGSSMTEPTGPSTSESRPAGATQRASEPRRAPRGDSQAGCEGANPGAVPDSRWASRSGAGSPSRRRCSTSAIDSSAAALLFHLERRADLRLHPADALPALTAPTAGGRRGRDARPLAGHPFRALPVWSTRPVPVASGAPKMHHGVGFSHPQLRVDLVFGHHLRPRARPQ